MQRMSMKHITLSLLLLGVIGVVVWAQWPKPSMVSSTLAASEAMAQAPISPQNESPLPATPTPLPPMPTPAATIEVAADWQTFSSPYWGVSFQYPPGWEVDTDPYDNGWDNVVVEEGTIDWQPGYPIALSSPNAEDGPIWITLNYYRLSENGSLAEWFELNQTVSRYDAMIPPNDEPYVIPGAYLPQDVDQAIFAVDSSYPIMPRYSIWFTGNGLVFSMHSSYNRINNIPNLLAILSTVQFEPISEERSTATNSFYGDEYTLRKKIAEVEADMADSCDMECEQQADYEMRQQALYDAMIQLPRHRPMMQAVTPAADDGTWLTYTQPQMGISFRYPPNVIVSDPFVENDLDESSLLQNSLTLHYENDSRVILEIEVAPYTVSPDVPLHNWEAIQDQLNRALHPNDQFRYRMPVPFYHENIPQENDDIVQTRQQAGYYQIDTFWASKDGVVYRLTNNELSVLYWAAGIFATLEFDTEQIAKLRDMSIFLGDERDMVDELATLWDRTPTPTPDPQSTPTPYPTITPTPPRPTPTVTPTPIYATATPSAFESPLMNGLMRYQGKTQYEGMTPYEIYYDPTKWQLMRIEGAEETDYAPLLLVHQHLINCSIDLNSWFAHAIGLDAISLAGREWGVAALDANTLGYITQWGKGSRSFTISLPEPIRIPYDANTKTLCELEAEKVFDTLVVLDQTSPGDAMPTITPTPN